MIYSHYSQSISAIELTIDVLTHGSSFGGAGNEGHLAPHRASFSANERTS
jgi:hypothetical protein